MATACAFSLKAASSSLRAPCATLDQQHANHRRGICRRTRTNVATSTEFDGRKRSIAMVFRLPRVSASLAAAASAWARKHQFSARSWPVKPSGPGRKWFARFGIKVDRRQTVMLLHCSDEVHVSARPEKRQVAISQPLQGLIQFQPGAFRQQGPAAKQERAESHGLSFCFPQTCGAQECIELPYRVTSLGWVPPSKSERL